MIAFNKYRNIIFDFDGVLAETNDIRFKGFGLLFKGYPENEVCSLIEFARANGGLSRYEKIRFFFEKVRKEAVSDSDLQLLAEQYSKLVKQKVVEAVPVKGSVEFLSDYSKTHNLAIVSGSDQEELKKVCRVRKIDHFFLEILGSPTSKILNIESLLTKMCWNKKSCLYIGDSINDLEAAQKSGIDFIGRNSGVTDWSSIGNIITFTDFQDLNKIALIN